MGNAQASSLRYDEMENLFQIQPFTSRSAKPGPKPSWLKIKIQTGESYNKINQLIGGLHLHTVCEEARCPNIYECWTHGTATFMLMGDICTRHCGFCAVGKGQPLPLDPEEPLHVAEAVRHLNLKHAVITSVNRDELSDGGAAHFAATIKAVRDLNPECKVEVLIPDFLGSETALATVLEAEPDVLNHNTETVSRLYRRVRPDAIYDRSLQLIDRAFQNKPLPGMLTKSGIMVGLGETEAEILQTMSDLRSANCEIMTIGQYLRPSMSHLPVERIYTPEEFDEFKRFGLELGFRYVESGPLVRSSYHAHEHKPVD
jgi:lipoic acid synthetase